MPSDLQIPLALTIPGQRFAIHVHHLQFDAENGPPLTGALLLLLLCRERVMFAQRCVDGADGRCFGHSPGVGQCNAVITLKGLGHRRRQRGAADQRTFKFRQPDLCPAHRRQQAGPDHRHAKPHRHLLGGQQLQQAVAIEVRPRQHQPRADHGGDKRRPPRVDMEHRHHRQQAVLRRYAGGVRLVAAQGVQDQRTMGIQHPFRPAGGSRGVAERSRSQFIELRPAIVCHPLLQQIVIKQQ